MVNSDEADIRRDGQPSEPEIDIQDDSERLAEQDMHPRCGWLLFLARFRSDQGSTRFGCLHWLADHEPSFNTNCDWHHVYAGSWI